MSKKKAAKREPKVEVDSKTVEYYMSLPYPILLTPLSEEDGGGWWAEIALISGCYSDGKTPNKAVKRVREVLKGWIEINLEDGDPIAEPEKVSS